MQRGAVECLGACVRACVGCVTSCLPRTNVHTTSIAKLTWVSVPYIRGMSGAIGSGLRPLGIEVAHRGSPWKWSMCNGLKDFIPERLRKGVIYKGSGLSASSNIRSPIWSATVCSSGRCQGTLKRI